MATGTFKTISNEFKVDLEPSVQGQDGFQPFFSLFLLLFLVFWLGYLDFSPSSDDPLASLLVLPSTQARYNPQGQGHWDISKFLDVFGPIFAIYGNFRVIRAALGLF
jgi:hypothetical protein